MSYLPRMSKTYKEPQELPAEEPEDFASGGTLKPASSLLNEKTLNPQMILKHYKYLPHAPPILPGPSALEEALENEVYRELSRMRRSASKLEATSNTTVVTPEEPAAEVSEMSVTESDFKIEAPEKVKRSQSKKTVKGSKTSVSRKKSSKSVRRENTNTTINMCLMGTDVTKPFTATTNRAKSRGDPDFLNKEELLALKREKTTLPASPGDVLPKSPKLSGNSSIQLQEEEEDAEVEAKPKRFISRSVQCTIFGCPQKISVIPPMINSLLRTLAFLFHELNKEEPLNNASGETKSLLTQIQLLLGDLCSQKVDKEYTFDTTYSDSKRLEKTVGELQKYMKDVYGDKGEYIDKMEDLRKVFIELKKKEMELAVLKEKLQETEEKSGEEVVVKESDLKNPEITLQNKRLEGEQLSAEAEFSFRELRNFQKTIAEIDWDIRNSQEQMTSLKKSVVSKSKTEMIGRKGSVHKFSSELVNRASRSKENESSIRKKT